MMKFRIHIPKIALNDKQSMEIVAAMQKAIAESLCLLKESKEERDTLQDGQYVLSQFEQPKRAKPFSFFMKAVRRAIPNMYRKIKEEKLS